MLECLFEVTGELVELIGLCQANLFDHSEACIEAVDRLNQGRRDVLFGGADPRRKLLEPCSGLEHVFTERPDLVVHRAGLARFRQLKGLAFD